jgi:hypothetical protein
VTPEKIVIGWAAGGFDALARRRGDRRARARGRAVGDGTTMRFRIHDRPALTDARMGGSDGYLAACRTFNILAAEGRKSCRGDSGRPLVTALP